MRTLKYLAIVYILICSIIWGQTSHDSLNLSIASWNIKYLSTRFDKQLNTYNLYTMLNFGQQTGDFFIGLNENYLSTLVRSAPKNIKDEHFFSFITEYSLNSNFKIGMLANNDILSDDRKIALNQASNSNISLYMKYFPFDGVYAAPFGGYSNNNQIGENNYGYIYGFEGLANNLQLPDMGINSSVKFLNEDIKPRKNSLRMFTLNLSNEISGSSKNVLNGYFVQNRKDFFYTADTMVAQSFRITNNIQSRIETNYYLEDRFILPEAYEGLSFELNGRSSWRTVDRDTKYRLLTDINPSVFDVKVEEFRLEFESAANYHSSLFDGTLRLNYSERDEKHMAKKFEESNIYLKEERIKAFEQRSSQESQKNNKAERISIAFTGNLRLSSRDNIFISLMQSKLRYDTPSNENYDDRDEILSIFRLYYLRNFTPFFDGFINLEGSLNHVVYIFSERSSNNNMARFLKLGSGGSIHNSVLSSKNQFEVSANYTVYDFEDLNPTYKSFSFRQLAFQDSSSLKLNTRTFVSLIGYLKYSEQGDFNWASFSGRPTRYLNEYYLEPKLNYTFNNLIFGTGIRYLLLRTFSYNKNVQHLESSYRSLGPISDLTFMMNNRLNLRFAGWYEFIKTEQNLRREVANLNLQINWGI
ncbi:MAG: hypothetical protein ACM34K_06010 [Bacillota bacterium]